MFHVKHAARGDRKERRTPFSTCCTCQEPYAHRTGTGGAARDGDAHDPAVSAQKAATCDAWKPRNELSNRPADEAFNTPQIATISIRRFPKQPKLREMRQPTRCRTSRLFVQKRPCGVQDCLRATIAVDRRRQRHADASSISRGSASAVLDTGGVVFGRARRKEVDGFRSIVIN